MRIDGRVGIQAYADGGTDQPVRVGSQGEMVVSDMNGFHYEQAMRGNMFLYGVSSQALLLAATTGGHPTIWNPSGSGMIFVPLKVCLSFISGTTVIGAVNWMITKNAGSAIGTAAPIVTFTSVAAQNCAVGGIRSSAKASAMNFAPTTNTFTAAPAYLAATGLNLGAAAPTGTGTYEAKQDGSLVIYPGNALSLCYTVTTSTALFAISIYGLELPIPAIA